MLWQLSCHINQTDSCWKNSPSSTLHLSPFLLLLPSHPSSSGIIEGGKISSSGSARIYSCFGVSSEIPALCQSWRWSRLYTSTPTGAHQLPPLLSHYGRRREVWEWGVAGAFASTLLISGTERKERKGRAGGGVVAAVTSAPVMSVCSYRRGLIRRKEGAKGHVRVCVCVYTLVVVGFIFRLIPLKL